MNGNIDTQGFMALVDQTRRERDRSWRELAAEIGVNYTTLSGLKTTHRQPRLDIFVKLIRWLHLAPAEAGRWII